MSMGPNGRHLVQSLDGVTKSNLNRVTNQTLLAMEGMGIIPVPGQAEGEPSIMVAGPPMRHHDVSTGPLVIPMAYMLPDGRGQKIDTTVNRDILLVGRGLNTTNWSLHTRVPFVNGRADYSLALSGVGAAQLYAFDPTTFVQGSAASFDWS